MIGFHQEDLLHKVMSVFTFMGANVMRHDDQYSFHVINRILETVVPALVTVRLSRLTGDKLDEVWRLEPSINVSNVLKIGKE